MTKLRIDHEALRWHITPSHLSLPFEVMVEKKGTFEFHCKPDYIRVKLKIYTSDSRDSPFISNEGSDFKLAVDLLPGTHSVSVNAVLEGQDDKGSLSCRRVESS